MVVYWPAHLSYLSPWFPEFALGKLSKIDIGSTEDIHTQCVIDTDICHAVDEVQ